MILDLSVGDLVTARLVQWWRVSRMAMPVAPGYPTDGDVADARGFRLREQW